MEFIDKPLSSMRKLIYWKKLWFYRKKISDFVEKLDFLKKDTKYSEFLDKFEFIKKIFFETKH